MNKPPLTGCILSLFVSLGYYILKTGSQPKGNICKLQCLLTTRFCFCAIKLAVPAQPAHCATSIRRHVVILFLHTNYHMSCHQLILANNAKNSKSLTKTFPLYFPHTHLTTTGRQTVSSFVSSSQLCQVVTELQTFLEHLKEFVKVLKHS